jgi:hypothetical protein
VTSITWHNARTNPPPPLVDVLLAVDDGDAEAAEGLRLVDADYYFLSTGHPVPAARVYAWAALPAKPTKAQLGIRPDANRNRNRNRNRTVK